MSTISRALLILALLVASTLARSDGIYNRTVGSWGFQDGINGGSVPVAPGPTGKMLMSDGTSFILQSDGTSKMCRAGGC